MGDQPEHVVSEQGWWWLVMGVHAVMTITAFASMLLFTTALASTATLQPAAPNTALLLCMPVTTGHLSANPAQRRLHSRRYLPGHVLASCVLGLSPTRSP